MTFGPSHALALSPRKPAFGRMVNSLVKPGTNYELLIYLSCSIFVFLLAACQAKHQAWIVKWAYVVFEENNFTILGPVLVCVFFKSETFLGKNTIK